VRERGSSHDRTSRERQRRRRQSVAPGGPGSAGVGGRPAGNRIEQPQLRERAQDASLHSFASRRRRLVSVEPKRVVMPAAAPLCPASSARAAPATSHERRPRAASEAPAKSSRRRTTLCPGQRSRPHRSYQIQLLGASAPRDAKGPTQFWQVSTCVSQAQPTKPLDPRQGLQPVRPSGRAPLGDSALSVAPVH